MGNSAVGVHSPGAILLMKFDALNINLAQVSAIPIELIHTERVVALSCYENQCNRSKTMISVRTHIVANK